MSTSGNYTFDLSTAGLIRVSFQRIGIVSAGQEPDSNQFAMGRDFLQMVLLDMQTDGIQLCRVQLTTSSLTPGTTQYTCAANVIDIDERTPFVSNSSNIDLPLVKISRGQYMALSNKTSSAPPSMIYVEKGATVTYFLYPTPDSTYTTITLPLILLQPDMTSAANTTGLPTRYLKTVSDKLCVMLCDHFGLNERKASLKIDATESTDKVNNDDTERGPVRFVPEIGIKFGSRW